MSVQFGRYNFDGKPVDPQDLEEVRPALAPYGPDGEGFICKGNLGILYLAFHTTKESLRETQPYVAVSGFVLTWDGRLDNREELIGQMTGEVSCHSADLDVVAAAYQRWGTDAFARLIGDWALSILDPRDQSLLLAKDFVGTRHLYYTVEENWATWCTILDPLVRLSKGQLKLQEEYIAGWLGFFPAAHLTPYVGIHAVPPSSFVRLTRGGQSVCRHWDFNPATKIRYRTDDEYEDHFRLAFGNSVRRRLRSHRPVLAELSGGMDSSSIVCMADAIITEAKAECPRLETLSYFNDSEPNWDERPYFAKVEEKRGRAGFHIDLEQQECLISGLEDDRFASTPVSIGGPNALTRQLAESVNAEGSRVVLSGIGGDEVAGGLPTPIPELQDLVARARFGRLARQLRAWALNQRRPWFQLLIEALMGFIPSLVARGPVTIGPAPWLRSRFVNHHPAALSGYERRVKLFGPLPSFQESNSALNALRRQFTCTALPSQPLHEKRYPYLDRDLLEFLYAVPREQLVRPGQRRSLMRRALIGVVPEEILNRRRKAFVTRSQVAAILDEWAILTQRRDSLISDSLGIVNAELFSESLKKARDGEAVPLFILQRTLTLEFWLRGLLSSGVLPPHVSGETKPTPSVKLDCGFETRSLNDQPQCAVAPIALPHDAEAVRVGDAHLDGLVDAGQYRFEKVEHRRAFVLGRIRQQDRVTACRQQLQVECAGRDKAKLVIRVRKHAAAIHPNDERISLCWLVTRWQQQDAA